VLPVHNEADAIENVVREIYDQTVSTYPRTMLRVYEYGSTDGTRGILISLRSRLPRLAVSLGVKRKGYVLRLSTRHLAMSSFSIPIVSMSPEISTGFGMRCARKGPT
jgi:glycosyltransferase involved in cell wall biosynthesis